MDLVLKTSGQQCPVGSNPTPSAGAVWGPNPTSLPMRAPRNRGDPNPERTRVSQSTKPARRGRRTVARHGALKSPNPFAQIMTIIGVILAVVLVSGAVRRRICRLRPHRQLRQRRHRDRGAEHRPARHRGDRGRRQPAAGRHGCLREGVRRLLRRPLHRQGRRGRAQRREHARAHLRQPAPGDGHLLPARPHDPDPGVHGSRDGQDVVGDEQADAQQRLLLRRAQLRRADGAEAHRRRRSSSRRRSPGAA